MKKSVLASKIIPTALGVALATASCESNLTISQDEVNARCDLGTEKLKEIAYSDSTINLVAGPAQPWSNTMLQAQGYRRGGINEIGWVRMAYLPKETNLDSGFAYYQSRFCTRDKIWNGLAVEVSKDQLVPIAKKLSAGLGSLYTAEGTIKE